MTDDTSKDMIGVVLVTHGNLATELVKVMEHVVGPQDQLTTITNQIEKQQNPLMALDGGIDELLQW